MSLIVNKNIPVLFQKLRTYDAEDDRFMKVKIWIMHTGENLNGSFFSKEVVTEAIPSLKNTPILAYIEDNSIGEKDFSDHRQELVKEDGKYSIKYLGQAIGVIPEDNNARFEMRLCDDGIEREFLTVEGLVWSSKWDDPVDIFNRDVIKSQSMELHHDYEGEWGKDKLFHFTRFKFFGACALGTDVIPAMKNSTIELQFDNESVFNEIQTKMEQFKQFNLDSTSLEVNHIDSQGSQQSNESQIELQGGDTVDKILEMLAKYNLTLEDLQAKEINHEDFSLEDLEEKVKAEFTQVDDNKDIVDNPADNFSLTISQLQEEVYRALEDFGTVVDADWGYEYSKYSLADIDTESSNVVAYDNENWYLVGFNYSVEGDKVSIDKESLRRFKVNYVPMELEVEDVTNVFDVAKSRFEKAVEAFSTKVGELTAKETSLQELQAEHDTLKTEYAEVSAEYSAKLQGEREQAEEEIFATFAKELTEDEMSEVKAKKDEMELEDIQDKLFALVGKKKAQFNFTKAKANKVITIAETEPEKPVLTGKSYDVLIEKYGQQ